MHLLWFSGLRYNQDCTKRTSWYALATIAENSRAVSRAVVFSLWWLEFWLCPPCRPPPCWSARLQILVKSNHWPRAPLYIALQAQCVPVHAGKVPRVRHHVSGPRLAENSLARDQPFVHTKVGRVIGGCWQIYFDNMDIEGRRPLSNWIELPILRSTYTSFSEQPPSDSRSLLSSSRQAGKKSNFPQRSS